MSESGQHFTEFQIILETDLKIFLEKINNSLADNYVFLSRINYKFEHLDAYYYHVELGKVAVSGKKPGPKAGTKKKPAAKKPAAKKKAATAKKKPGRKKAA